MILGGGLIGLLGYFGVFLLSSILTFLSIFTLLLFPQRRDQNVSGNLQSPLSYCELLSVRRSFFTLLSYGLAGLLLFSLEPTLAIKLKNDFNLPTASISLFFLLMLLGFTLFCMLSTCLPEQQDKRGFMIGANFLLALAAFTIGPSQILHLPNSTSLIGVGLFLGGGGRGIIACFTVVEAITGGVKQFPAHESRVSDIVSSVYTLWGGISMLVFPIIGSVLTEAWGFSRAMEVIGLCLLLSTGIYTSSTIIDWRKEKQSQQRASLEEKNEEQRHLL